MLKGCQREMIVLQTQDSVLFESAYFVLRKEKRAVPKTDLLAEANRIIGAGNEYLKRRKKLPLRLFLFVGGVLAGMAISLLFGLIFH